MANETKFPSQIGHRYRLIIHINNKHIRRSKLIIISFFLYFFYILNPIISHIPNLFTHFPQLQPFIGAGLQ